MAGHRSPAKALKHEAENLKLIDKIRLQNGNIDARHIPRAFPRLIVRIRANSQLPITPAMQN